ncbi:helix-turn-helix transcriptional regulator [Desulfosporosinus sp. OT]|uniref:helix-turn-helix domain-containing protein n=1 Tax=Desulfosporosinus sp. OT TaxID=913865 RepID=UPI0002239CF1|nr:helix-turn-helix transcriptional regulator [Desulfosporosinus sp. OT]EGW39356.1 helix-turn-helix family protein [Desulfosporosinus sp. OT]
MTFGQRMKNAREEKGLTQKELAEILFLGESTISFYESDKREPKFDILYKISEALEISVDYLIGRTNIPNPTISNDPDDDIQPTPPDRIRTFQKKIGELSPESLSFLEFQLEKLRELDIQAVEHRRAKRDTQRNKK